MSSQDEQIQQRANLDAIEKLGVILSVDAEERMIVVNGKTENGERRRVVAVSSTLDV